MTDEQIRALAKERYALPSGNSIEIDGDAELSHADDGTWVQAWVWVPRPPEEPAAGEEEQDDAGALQADV